VQPEAAATVDPAGAGGSVQSAPPRPESASVRPEPEPQYRYFRTGLAASGYVPGADVARATSPYTEDRMALARDPDCPVDLMYLLSKDSLAVCEELAGNPSLPGRFHVELAAVSGPIALRLLGNPFLAPAAFESMVAAGLKRHAISPRRDYGVRMDGYRLTDSHWREAVISALSDPRCPVEVLATHCSNTPGYVRRAIALNPSSPPWILDRMARIYTDQACEPIPANPATALETLIWLAVRSGYEGIRDDCCRAAVARGTDSARTMLLHFTTRRRQTFVDFLPQHLLEELARDPDPRVRYPIAVVTRDAALLRSFADDEHGRIRRAASQRLMSLMGL
jgi:hypothetical protein